MRKIALGIIVFFLYLVSYSQNNFFLSGTVYYPPKTIYSPNRMYKLKLQNNGYLVLSKITPYGLIPRWSYPESGTGEPQSSVFIDNSKSYSTVDVGFDNLFWINHPTYIKGLTVSDNGDVQILSMSGNVLWRGQSSDMDMITNGSGAYPQYARIGADFYFPEVLKDKFNTHYFTKGKIVFPGGGVVLEGPVTFSAGAYIDFLPGFSVGAGSGADVFLAKPLGTGSAPARASRVVPEMEVTSLSGLTVFPNPTTNLVNLKLLNASERIISVKLFDSKGANVFKSGSVNLFSIQHLTAGTYHYEIISSVKTYTGNLIKQ